jgi:hypothetical protein
MDTKDIFTEIDNVLADMIKTLSLFSQDEINAIPFEDSWTPGQVAQHIILSDSGFAKLLSGPAKDTDRQPDQHVDQLKAIFLNFDIKMKSPDFILPPAIDYKKDELLANLAQIRNQLNQFDKTSDMTKTCTGMELPVMGYLTRIEAATFIIVHTKRHIHQLGNIYIKQSITLNN